MSLHRKHVAIDIVLLRWPYYRSKKLRFLLKSIVLNPQILELKKLFESDIRLPRYRMSKSGISTILATTFFLFSLFFLNPVANMAANYVCINRKSLFAIKVNEL